MGKDVRFKMPDELLLDRPKSKASKIQWDRAIDILIEKTKCDEITWSTFSSLHTDPRRNYIESDNFYAVHKGWEIVVGREYYIEIGRLQRGRHRFHTNNASLFNAIAEKLVEPFFTELGL